MNLKSLFAKLNETSRTATESAAALCLSEHHYDVEVEHLLLQLLDNSDSDLAPILRHYEVVAERLQAQLVEIGQAAGHPIREFGRADGP